MLVLVGDSSSAILGDGHSGDEQSRGPPGELGGAKGKVRAAPCRRRIAGACVRAIALLGAPLTAKLTASATVPAGGAWES